MTTNMQDLEDAVRSAAWVAYKTRMAAIAVMIVALALGVAAEVTPSLQVEAMVASVLAGAIVAVALVAQRKTTRARWALHAAIVARDVELKVERVKGGN